MLKEFVIFTLISFRSLKISTLKLSSSCFIDNWQVVKPLLQERTRKKVHVLKGCGMEELLKVNNGITTPDMSFLFVLLTDNVILNNKGRT